MEILNIGPLELIIILVLMFILLGPRDMILTAQRIGRWVREIVHSPMWREIMGYSVEIRDLPKKIMEESGLQETLAEIQQTTKETTDELNAQIREVTDAARVPEAEHLRLDTGPVPAQAENFASLPEPAAPAVAEAAAAETAEAEVVTAPAEEQSAEAQSLESNPIETAAPAEPVTEKKPRRRKVTSTSADEGGVADAAQPVKRPRTRKPRPVEAVQEAAPDAPASNDATAFTDAAASTDAAEPAEAAPETTLPPQDALPSAPSNGTVRKPRKPRAPKVLAAQELTVQPAEGPEEPAPEGSQAADAA